jgi:hypothetical protein
MFTFRLDAEMHAPILQCWVHACSCGRGDYTDPSFINMAWQFTVSISACPHFASCGASPQMRLTVWRRVWPCVARHDATIDVEWRTWLHGYSAVEKMLSCILLYHRVLQKNIFHAVCFLHTENRVRSLKWFLLFYRGQRLISNNIWPLPQVWNCWGSLL